MKLTFDFRHYWIAGTGAGRGGHVDATVRRDELSLPLLPGRTVKGLLRDAVRQAEAFGWYGEGTQWAETLFGRPAVTRAAAADGIPQPSVPGALRVGDARLPQAFRAAVAGLPAAERGPLAAGLFSEMYATAIDEVTGTAVPHSLRGTEVAVPCALEAEVTPLREVAGWQEVLQAALPLLRAAGSHRTRGHGRVEIKPGEAA